KDERLLAAFDEFGRDPAGLMQITAPDSELLIHDGWIVEDEVFGAAGRAILIDKLEGGFGQCFGELLWISYRGRATDELRLRPVKFANAPKPPNEVGQVAAVHAAIGVKLVNHDKAEVFEAFGPLSVVRQDPAV